jgi:putative ABC transport system permease protein
MRFAWDGLRRRPARSAATALGIGLATGLVVLLLALSSGITVSSTQLAAESGVDLLATSANSSLLGASFPPIPAAHALAGAAERADPNVATASPWLLGDLVYANASLYASVNASPGGGSVPPGWAPTSGGVVGWIPELNAGLNTPSLRQGSGLPGGADAHYANGSYDGPASHAIVLDDGLAQLLGVAVGAPVWLSPSSPSGPGELAAWFGNATEFRVAGISTAFWLVPSAHLAFGYLSEVQSLLGPTATEEDAASLLLVHLHDPSDPERDRALLAAAFPALTVFTLAEILGAVESSVELYRTFGTLVGAIGVACAALFTTTVLLMSVDDRSREIALLRALGFGPGWIARETIDEALLLAGAGLAVGAPIGYLAAEAVDRFLRGLLPGLPASFSFVSFDPGVIAGTLAIVLGVGVVAAIAPLARALRLPLAEELRAP